MLSRTKLSAVLCCALLTSVSGVAAQAAPETPSESTQPVDGTVQTPAEQPVEEAAAPADATPPPAAPAQTTEEEATAAPAPAAEPAPSPAAAETQASTGIVLKTATADAKIDTDEEPEQPATCGSGSIALSAGGCTKPWRVIGYGEYRMLAVRDEDPKNDQSLRFFVQGSYRLAKKYNVSVWGRIRYLQNFVAEVDESAARFQDPLLGIDYLHSLSFEDKGAKWANLSFQHRLTGTIPAQRETRKNDLYTRISGLERVRLNPISSLYVGPDLVTGYNFYEYAEAPGPQGGVLPQVDTTGVLVVEYFPWQSEKYGSILVGVDAGVGYTLLHKGRGGEVAQESNRWRQNYSWDAYAYYMPIPQIWAGVAVSHGMGVLRDGAAVYDFVNRDATLLSFSVTALY